MLALALAAALLVDPTVKPKAEAPRAQQISSNAAPATLALVAVTLECTARTDGRVENCQVLGETHPGLGFDRAAIALMRDARVEPGPRDVQFARTIQFTP